MRLNERKPCASSISCLKSFGVPNLLLTAKKFVTCKKTANPLGIEKITISYNKLKYKTKKDLIVTIFWSKRSRMREKEKR